MLFIHSFIHIRLNNFGETNVRDTPQWRI